MTCKHCKKEASEGRPLLFSPIIRITRSKAVRRSVLNDLNGAKGVIRLFDCFFKDNSVLAMENEVSMKIKALLIYKDLVKYNIMKQNILCGEKSTHSQFLASLMWLVVALDCKSAELHDRLVTYHGGSRWKRLLA